MIEVILSQNGCVIDRFKFDVDRAVHHSGCIVSIHPGSMRTCARPGDLWHSVALAAAAIAETSSRWDN